MRLFQHAALTVAMLVLAGSAQAASIDLNDFFADPTVTVSADGSMATLAEDEFFAMVILSNDPGFGEPNIIVPELGPMLRFEYEFLEPTPDNQDEFSAFVLDALTGLSIGGMWEFVTQEPGSGTVTFDLTSLTGQTLGLEFQLNALVPGDDALTSTVKISNVRLEANGGGDGNGNGNGNSNGNSNGNANGNANGNSNGNSNGNANGNGNGGGVPAVPEPGTLLLVTGSLALLYLGRRRIS